jgi:phosphopantothenoylcysteine decarboxylase/phosphopantothenate--cysteine ligase
LFRLSAAFVSPYQSLVALRCLITAGPTREFLDPVRFLSNPSTGKMGFALAEAARDLGMTVDLVAGPVSLPEPRGVMLYPVVTAEQMYHQVDGLFGPCDLFLSVAAVSDWRPKVRHAQKVRREAGAPALELEPCPDILRAMVARRRAGQVVVGFAAETGDLEVGARAKLASKGVDFLAANDVGGPAGAFGSETNRILLLGAAGSRHLLGPASKAEVARALLAAVLPSLAPR